MLWFTRIIQPLSECSYYWECEKEASCYENILSGGEIFINTCETIIIFG